MNFYEKRNKKSVFSKKELASMLNVDEEKIKELENGERSITGETLDEYMKLINTTKKEKDIQKLELLNWLKSINLKSVREEFGFGRQKDVSKKVGLQQSIICRLERNAIKDPSFLTLYKLHKFFTDDFNKKVKTEVEEDTDYTAPSGFGVVMQAGSLMPCSEPIEEEPIHSTFEVTPECFEEDKEEIDTTISAYTPEETFSIARPKFEKIDEEEKEELKKKIARYEKIIDYILKGEK